MGISRKILVGTVGACLLSGSIGVYAGSVIESYKTPRGNIATVENETVHKNRIGMTVNGKEIKLETWYANNTTYAPLQAVAESLGATVNYNEKKMSADIVLPHKISTDLNTHETYYGTAYAGKQSNPSRTWPFEFKITSINPRTGELEGELTWTSLKAVHKIVGKVSDNKLIFREADYIKKGNALLGPSYTLTYNGIENKYKGTWTDGKNEVVQGDIFISLD
ncbi:stalk domain-containing protein [Sporosarcina sp. 179-K 8C2 HS]|uniref:stalk domain-containing protein n=1 Tax=Sporosarcina sp. 179-K 8C2 HS TaxID=3142387 RepID=UPI0039A04D51